MVDLRTDPLPSAALFDGVPGQPAAVGQLRVAARRPVHAYLFHGPPGSGKQAAAHGFAAALLCPEGGCGVCNTCRRALAGTHSDLVRVDRTGASIDMDGVRTIVARAQRQPVESGRQVVMVTDIHLAGRVAPALLKTVEEPPPTTVFVLIGDEMPPSLVTLASRCVQVQFDPVPATAVAGWLVGQGITREVAQSVAEVSGGRLDRARLMATDSTFAERVARWHSVPTRLDGTGAVAFVVASELIGAADAALVPLRRRHAAEISELAERAEAVGARGIPGRKEVEDRHKREERRWRTDELRIGLSVLVAAYRDRLVANVEPTGWGSPGGESDSRRLVASVAAIEDAARSLERNPNEALLLEALLAELSGMGR